jgi:transcriptional regulator with XRE-family HTH domain
MALDLHLFGNKLRRYREQLELSLGEISHATGIGEEELAAFEKGERSREN